MYYSSLPMQPGKDSLQEASDPVLQQYIWLAESGISVGVTILVRGMLIAGDIISARTYLQQCGEELVTIFQRQHQEDAARAVSTHFEAAAERMEAEPDELRYQYLHLQGARILVNGTNPGTNPLSTPRGRFWRCPLAIVEGFMLGRIGTQ